MMQRPLTPSSCSIYESCGNLDRHGGEEKMIRSIILSVGLAAFSLSSNARAQGAPGYTYGPVTLVNYIHVNYGHFDDYMAWVTSTWVPTMEAEKKAGVIIGYKVF